MTNPMDYLYNLAVQWAKSNNTNYENIALQLNRSNDLGYNLENIDALKHTIAAADGATSDGAFWTNTLGYGNEIYAAYRGRDGYNEHVKDLNNNHVGIAVSEWLQNSLGRPPTLEDILTIMPLVSKLGILADRGTKLHGDVGILSALSASLGGGLVHGLIDKSVRKKLDDHASEILRLISDQARRCFTGDTAISTADGGSKPIAEIRVGDVVMSFDPTADGGRGALVPKRVKRLFRNTTTEWIKLTWLENGEAKELVATPGHHILDKTGVFTRLDLMVQNGKAEVVLASGEVVEAKAELITYSAETAHLFEQAASHTQSAANGAVGLMN
jgi:hypothetical protein